MAARLYNFKLLPHICRECNKEFQGHSNVRYCSQECQNKKANEVKRKQYGRISNLDHFIKEKLSLASLRGKYEVTLDYNDIRKLWDEQKGLCALSKVPMTYFKGRGKVNTNLSLDRIDSSKPYELGNVQLVCVQVNYMKSDLNKEQLLYWCKEIINGC